MKIQTNRTSNTFPKFLVSGADSLIRVSDQCYLHFCFKESLTDPRGNSSSTINARIFTALGENPCISNLFLISSVLLDLSEYIKFAMSFT